MQDLIGRTLGHYRIVEKIGEGGMGVVYRARDERLDRDVAIKVLPEEVAGDPDRMRRFEREAKVVGSLNHPNILEIWDFSSEDGIAYAVMELLEGESLRKLISKGSITAGKAVEYARTIADGLAAAHDKGIIHRDLKPENVFLTTDSRIKILDFGLAKLKLPEADFTTETPTVTLDTAPGGLIGTVPYMAPEQVQGQPADHRSDIFALGVVLYEMLTGHRPFGGSTTVETAAAILKEDPEPISVAAPSVSPALGSVVLKCLEKRPEDRFSSAHDLSLTLGAIDTTASHDRSVLAKRWPHILAVVIAAVIGLLVIFPPEVLFERRKDEPVEAPLPRIVVLPFENLGSPEDEFFADGITEEIISRLSAVSGLLVISRTSAMHYKGTDKAIRQIGEELDVGYVLEGTIRWDREGEGHGHVRITPQLIQVANDSHLWSDRYDRVLEDLFTVQSDIAEQVIAQLEATILESESPAVLAQPTENMEAYQAYLLGIQFLQRSSDEPDLRLAIEMLERAVELDPEFALAHARLSEAYSFIFNGGFMGKSEEVLTKAKDSAERALELQPGLPEAQCALGWYHFLGFRDYDLAREHFAAAAERLPNDPDVLKATFAIARRIGRWDEAIAAIERWRCVDPNNSVVDMELLMTYQLLRQYEKAEEVARRVTVATDRTDGFAWAAWNYLLWDGTTDRARLLLESAPSVKSPWVEYMSILLDLLDRRPAAVMARLGEASIGTQSLYLWYVPRELLECVCLFQLGEKEKAAASCEEAVELLEREIASTPQDTRLHVAIGHAFALLGRKEEAVRAGERAVELVPISKDALEGPFQLIELAKIYSRVGEHDEALRLIDQLLSIPCDLSVGMLRLDPVWDPLRDNPRFQAVLEKFDTN